jgi:hypothetical protein
VTVLYEKRGRKYVPVQDRWDDGRDCMKVGQFRLTYCYSEGGRRYEYNVTPATASFVAAATVAREAMEDAIRQRAISTEHIKNVPYTKKQLEILTRFRKEMSDAGGLWPNWWQHTSAYELSEAAIKAVQEFKP